jgi:hypothetical protein
MSVSIPLQLLLKCQLLIRQNQHDGRLGLDMSTSTCAPPATMLEDLIINFDAVCDNLGRGIRVSVSSSQVDVLSPTGQTETCSLSHFARKLQLTPLLHRLTRNGPITVVTIRKFMLLHSIYRCRGSPSNDR